MSFRAIARGFASTARPLVLFGAGLLAALTAFGCSASHAPPGESPGTAETAPLPPSLTGYPLLVDPVEDRTSGRDVAASFMEDFRNEIRSVMERDRLFSSVVLEPPRGTYIRLRPVIFLNRVMRPEDQDPSAEMEIRFELTVSGSRGLVWHAEYREQSPREILYQSPFPERQRLLATQAIRYRILDSLRRDLTRFLVAY